LNGTNARSVHHRSPFVRPEMKHSTTWDPTRESRAPTTASRLLPKPDTSPVSLHPTSSRRDDPEDMQPDLTGSRQNFARPISNHSPLNQMSPLAVWGAWSCEVIPGGTRILNHISVDTWRESAMRRAWNGHLTTWTVKLVLGCAH
jgi:hypothetical protein